MYSLRVFHDQCALSAEVLLSIGIDDSELALLENSVLHVDAEQQQMRQLNHMDWANTTLSEKVGPVFLCVFIVDAILEIVRKQILKLDRRVKFDPHVGIDARHRIILVVRSVHLEIERW